MLKPVEKIVKEYINNYINKCHKQGIYTLLESKEFQEIISNKDISYKNVNYFIKAYGGWDKTTIIPLEIGRYIESLVENKDIIVGVNRVDYGTNFIENPELQDKLETGVYNYGALKQGIIMDKPDINKTVATSDRLLNTMIHIKTSYEGSTGCLLFAFPKDAITPAGEVINNSYDKLYNYKEISGKEISIIKPEYIVGYISNLTGVMNYYPKEELIKEINESKQDENDRHK